MATTSSSSVSSRRCVSWRCTFSFIHVEYSRVWRVPLVFPSLPPPPPQSCFGSTSIMWASRLSAARQPKTCHLLRLPRTLRRLIGTELGFQDTLRPGATCTRLRAEMWRGKQWTISVALRQPLAAESAALAGCSANYSSWVAMAACRRIAAGMQAHPASFVAAQHEAQGGCGGRGPDHRWHDSRAATPSQLGWHEGVLLWTAHQCSTCSTRWWWSPSVAWCSVELPSWVA